jgi:hypothetical protein
LVKERGFILKFPTLQMLKPHKKVDFHHAMGVLQTKPSLSLGKMQSDCHDKDC